MTDLLVIVPSRCRPQAVAELARALEKTCTADTSLLFALDDDDPTGNQYVGEVHKACVGARFDHATSMVEALNLAVADVLAEPVAPYAIAFMGDDHRPRTVGWDTRYLAALRRLGTGMVYGNDLVQGERLPTHIAMTSDIPRALGFMAPPSLHHLYVDNFWRDLGVHSGCIRYLTDVEVEHLHPVAGTAELDEGYTRVNAPEVYEADRKAYREFARSGNLAAAVQKVRALLPADPKPGRLVGMARASLVAEAAYITGGRTVADVAEWPTDLSDLLGPALQVRHVARGEADADVVCLTGQMGRTPDLAGARAAVACGVPLPRGFTMLRTRMIGAYPVSLGVRS